MWGRVTLRVTLPGGADASSTFLRNTDNRAIFDRHPFGRGRSDSIRAADLPPSSRLDGGRGKYTCIIAQFAVGVNIFW